MEWWAFLGIFIGSLIGLLLMRVPVAFAMLGVGIVAAVLTFGGIENGLGQVARSANTSINTFVLSPVPLFILMGEVLLRSGVIRESLATLNRALGRLPGRLAMLATGGGTLFGLLSGSTLASTAVLGSSLLPEMQRSGYSQRLGMGSILGAGGLTMIIPPSSLVVVWGAIAQVSVGPLLIAGIIPGFLMALGYVVVILIWATFFRGAPKDDEASASSAFGGGAERGSIGRDLLVWVAPLGLVVFAVLGLIYFGIATPTESAATGAVGALLLVAAYRRLTRDVLRVAIGRSVVTNTMIFFIVVGATLYSQVTSFSGATRGFVNAIIETDVGGIGILIMLMLVVLVLGAFMDQISIMLLIIPLFMPVAAAQGWDPIWFSIIMLINLQIAGTTPPFGLNLFVMKGVAPPETTMRDLYWAAAPFIGSDVAMIALLIAAPFLVTILPQLMMS